MRQRAHAVIWKNQEALTKVKKLDENKLSLEERLRVRIALKVMRKAHIHGSRAQKDKLKTSPEAILERLGFNKGKKKKMDMSSERAMYAVDLDTFQPKNLDQIQQEAKSCFAIKRERMKLERQSAKFGKVRPVFPELIEEIKQEFKQKAMEKHKKELANTSVDDLPEPFRKQMAHDALAKLTGALTASTLINRGNRGRVVPVVPTNDHSNNSSPSARPHTAPAMGRR